MVEGEFFDKLEEIARLVRGNQRPFGGIQVCIGRLWIGNTAFFAASDSICTAGYLRRFHAIASRYVWSILFLLMCHGIYVFQFREIHDLHSKRIAGPHVLSARFRYNHTLLLHRRIANIKSHFGLYSSHMCFDNGILRSSIF